MQRSIDASDPLVPPSLAPHLPIPAEHSSSPLFHAPMHHWHRKGLHWPLQARQQCNCPIPSQNQPCLWWWPLGQKVPGEEGKGHRYECNPRCKERQVSSSSGRWWPVWLVCRTKTGWWCLWL